MAGPDAGHSYVLDKVRASNIAFPRRSRSQWMGAFAEGVSDNTTSTSRRLASPARLGLGVQEGGFLAPALKGARGMSRCVLH